MNMGSSGWVKRISFQGAGEVMTGGAAGTGEVMPGAGEVMPEAGEVMPGAGEVMPGAEDVFVFTTTTEMSESTTHSPAISLVTEKVQCTLQ